MRFRKLRLAGFKSFVDPAELRIEDGLTGVVGPNGCGKSNLLEAIRWVMGESSPKSLRGGGMEDVIFAGTSVRPSRDFADVTLLLDNSARTAPAQFNDGDEIEVMRRIERGLGSAYRINGRDVRQKDVQLLFADAATGAHSPALVSQGRIGAIIAAKPQERRAMLEEAAGIAGLHVRRKDAEQRLRAAEANLARLDDVLQNMEAQAASLKRQARQAERYRTLTDRIGAVEARLLHARWRAAAEAARAASAGAAEIEAKLAAVTRASAELSARQANAAADLPALRQAEAEAAAALQALNQAAQALVAELAGVERRQRELDAAAQTVARDRDREVAIAADAAEALDRLAGEAVAIEARLAGARGALADMAARVAAAEQQASAHERELAERMAAQADAQARQRAGETALMSADQRLKRAAAEVTRLQTELAGVRATDGGDAAVAAAESAQAEAEAAIAAASAAIEAADAARRAADAARETGGRALDAARGSLSGATAERDTLTRLLARPAGGGQAAVLDRIRVAAGAEKALAAALGDDLQAGVGKTGQGRSWAGAKRLPGDPALPKGLVALATLVEAPAELARRLAQIGVVDGEPGPDLVAALVPGQRIVSRDGRLWRWDGFEVHGGGGSAAAERLEQRNRLADVEAGLPALEAALAEARTAVEAARGDYDRAAADERAARERRSAAERQRDAARSRLTELAAAAAKRASRIEGLEAAVKRANEESEAAAREAVAAREALDALPNLEAVTIATGEARARAEASRAALASARADHAGLARTIDADAQRLAAVASDRAGWERRRDGSAAQVAELDGRASAIAEEQASLAEAPARIAARQSALATEIAEAETARRGAADRLAAAEAALRAIDAELRATGEAVAEAREERARLSAQLENHEQRRQELSAASGERFGCPPPVLAQRYDFPEDEAVDIAGLQAEMDRLVAERERIGPVNLRAEVELEELETTRAGSAAEREELETAIARLRGSIGSLNREGRARLLAAFEAVDAHFRELFTTLFNGGQAHLALIDSDDPLEAGLEIMAQPPGKKLQSLTLLSGGEQALTAVALIFALFLTNPAPICVLDEVDAPLDDANVERFCDLLDRMSELTDTRFLIVTHNAVTMSRMHRLFGVTMAEKGVSQLVSVDLARAEQLVAAE